jgi:hypothetical protein
MVWEVYPTGGDFGASHNPHVVFHCLTDTHERPRVAELGADEAEAERRVEEASDEELIELLDQSRAMA